MKFKLAVTQVCRVERITAVEVEADSLEDAIEIQQESDAPAYDDPCWVEHVDLMHEEIKEYTE